MQWMEGHGRTGAAINQAPLASGHRPMPYSNEALFLPPKKSSAAFINPRLVVC